MDSGTIIIGAISIAICILPFIMLRRNKQRIEKQRLLGLENLAAQHRGNITQHEFCGDFVIGLDEANKFVFFFRKTKDRETARHINLDGIQKCKAINTSRSIQSKEGEYKVVDRLELVFVPGTKNEPDLVLELYNAEESMQLVGELQLIDRWEKKINQLLNNERSR